MRAILIITSFLALVACRDRKEHSVEAKNGVVRLSHQDTNGLSHELRSKIIEYQRRYPLPTSKALYVYIATFFTKKSDTLLAVMRSGQGVIALEGQKLLGPYSDEILYPIVIKDSKELYGKNFILEEIHDSIKLVGLTPLRGHDYPESYPPIYTFLVRGNRLKINKIDTIWPRWD